MKNSTLLFILFSDSNLCYRCFQRGGHAGLDLNNSGPLQTSGSVSYSCKLLI
jgi:hypothetical protein